MTMGSAGSSKKAPAKKSQKPKPHPAKARVGAKSHKAGPGLAVASAAAAQHLRIGAAEMPVCIVDNGGWTVKYGLVPPPPAGTAKVTGCDGHADGGESSVHNHTTTALHEAHARDNGSDGRMAAMFNATARPPHQLTILAGDEITARMKNLGQLSWTSPLERGLICHGETQLRVWARVLEVLGVVPRPRPALGSGRTADGGFLATLAAARRGRSPVAVGEQQERVSADRCAFLLLVSPFEPSVISEGVDLMLFRELGLARVARLSGPCMAAARYLSTMDRELNNGGWRNDETECCCVVDSGYSFTHVVPTQRGDAVSAAIRRLDIGGKVLTNLLKEAVTYRQWNMMEEFHIVNDAKEKLCFVTNDFEKEMKRAQATRKGLRWFDREYLLPDFVTTFQGSVRLPEPLQRKKEVEELEQIKKEMERLGDEKERRELEKEVKELSNRQGEDEREAKEDKSAVNKSEDHQKREADKPRTAQKKKRKHRHEQEENADADDSGLDSDEETDQQRLRRLKALREAERQRREQESGERQALALSVERFAVPEVLFRPSDIGLDCGGLAEAIVESVGACAPLLRAAMYHNVVLVGGNARIPGFRDRVEVELRKLAPANYEVRVYLPEDPASYAWEGAKQFSRRPGFQERFSVDRLSWEAMKKKGMTQPEIWDKKMAITP